MIRIKKVENGYIVEKGLITEKGDKFLVLKTSIANTVEEVGEVALKMEGIEEDEE